MSDYYTSLEHQVIQVISFTILNDSDFEESGSREGKRWIRAMRTIKQQDGWVQTLYGRDMSSLHKVDLYVGESGYMHLLLTGQLNRVINATNNIMDKCGVC